MELSESQSHSSISSVLTNLKSSELQIQQDGLDTSVSQLLAEARYTTELLFAKKCNGIMGVPVTFMDKYNPEQFEIIDINPHFFVMVEHGLPKLKQLTLKNVGQKDPYARILIKRKNNKECN